MIKFFPVVLCLILAAFIAQLFLPPLMLLKGAAILFVPTVLYYGCLVFPLPLVLALVFFTGLLNDLLTVPQAAGSLQNHDYPLGTSVLLYLIPSLIMHGCRPWFLGRRWLTHLLLAELSAVLTPFLLLAQYGILSFQRRDFFYSDVILWRILGPGLIAGLLAPCIFVVLSLLSQLVRYQPRFGKAS